MTAAVVSNTTVDPALLAAQTIATTKHFPQPHFHQQQQLQIGTMAAASKPSNNNNNNNNNSNSSSSSSNHNSTLSLLSSSQFGNNDNNNENNDEGDSSSDSDDFEISVEEEQEVVDSAKAVNAEQTAFKLEANESKAHEKKTVQTIDTGSTNHCDRNNNNNKITIKHNNNKIKSSTSNNKDKPKIKPLLLQTVTNTPLLIDIDMNMPLVSYIQPTSPLLGYVHPGDVLVYIDGRSTADLSHLALTRLLNGKNKGNSGGRKLVILPGTLHRQLQREQQQQEQQITREKHNDAMTTEGKATTIRSINGDNININTKDNTNISSSVRKHIVLNDTHNHSTIETKDNVKSLQSIIAPSTPTPPPPPATATATVITTKTDMKQSTSMPLIASPCTTATSNTTATTTTKNTNTNEDDDDDAPSCPILTLVASPTSSSPSSVAPPPLPIQPPHNPNSTVMKMVMQIESCSSSSKKTSNKANGIDDGVDADGVVAEDSKCSVVDVKVLEEHDLEQHQSRHQQQMLQQILQPQAQMKQQMLQQLKYEQLKEKERELRKKRGPVTIDVISIKQQRNHSNNNNLDDDDDSDSDGSASEISTIYGGRWNPSLYCTAHRVEDLGCLEEGYYHLKQHGNTPNGIGLVIGNDNDNGGYGYYTTNQHHHHHHPHQHTRMLGLSNPQIQHYEHDAKIRNATQEKQDEEMKELALKKLTKQHQRLEGVFLSLIFGSIGALAVILVMVVRGK